MHVIPSHDLDQLTQRFSQSRLASPPMSQRAVFQSVKKNAIHVKVALISTSIFIFFMYIMKLRPWNISTPMKYEARSHFWGLILNLNSHCGSDVWSLISSSSLVCKYDFQTVSKRYYIIIIYFLCVFFIYLFFDLACVFIKYTGLKCHMMIWKILQ